MDNRDTEFEELKSKVELLESQVREMENRLQLHPRRETESHKKKSSPISIVFKLVLTIIALLIIIGVFQYVSSG